MVARNRVWISRGKNWQPRQECQTLFGSFRRHRTAYLGCELWWRKWWATSLDDWHASWHFKHHRDSYFRRQPLVRAVDNRYALIFRRVTVRSRQRRARQN